MKSVKNQVRDNVFGNSHIIILSSCSKIIYNRIETKIRNQVYNTARFQIYNNLWSDRLYMFRGKLREIR